MTIHLDAPAAPPRGPVFADADVLDYRSALTPGERARLDELTAVFRSEIAPVVGAHWTAGTFPHELLPVLARLGLVGLTAEGGNALLHGFIHLELARVDTSISTFLGVHSELYANALAQLGSAEQRQRLLPAALELREVGAFALTEPEHGSDISRGMATSARREGESWVLDGVKRWIGNAPFADRLLVWARDAHDGVIRGFLVPCTSPGVHVETIPDKIGLRIVQNGEIRLDGVRVAERDRLPGSAGFRDTGRLLAASRVWVAWQTAGLQFAAYDEALRYAQERHQFGRPLASFQLIQDKLVRILDNATATLGALVRVAQMQDAGQLRPEHAALVKASGSAKMRESVALARGISGGNGILGSEHVARVFADAEAVYSYEGSYEINTLIVGRGITGLSAFA